jgi:hypothetical protein
MPYLLSPEITPMEGEDTFNVPEMWWISKVNVQSDQRPMPSNLTDMSQ